MSSVEVDATVYRSSRATVNEERPEGSENGIGEVLRQALVRSWLEMHRLRVLDWEWPAGERLI